MSSENGSIPNVTYLHCVEPMHEYINPVQEQLDEVELLQAMSKTGEFEWTQDTQNGCISGTLNISLQLVHSIKLSIVKANDEVACTSSTNIIPANSATNQSHVLDQESTELFYLPPISLYFQLPPTYPAKDPPSYTISCKWMNFSFLSKLCSHLDKLWSDGVGSVILYTWQQFLTTEVFSLLGVGPEHHYILRVENSGNTNSDWDCRAVQDIALPQLLLPHLIEYDMLEKEQHFSNSFFNCEICFLSIPGSKCVKNTSCGHVHCKDCLSSHICTKIAEGDVTSIECPNSDCTSTINISMIKDIVPSHLFERFDSLLLQRTLDGMSDIAYCPRPSCQCVSLKEEDSNMSLCPRCKFAFCILCKRAWHGVSPCLLLPSDLKELRATWETLDDKEKLLLEKQYGKRKLYLAFQELDSSLWIESNAKRCPNCNSKIQKTDGCNKMTCSQCQSHFCWLCDTKLPKHDPYGHFRIVGGGCTGKLFEGLKGFNDF